MTDVSSGWIQLLGNQVESMFAIIQCEYCHRMQRYDTTMEFYCRGCGAPLPNTIQYQAEQERNSYSPYWADGGIALRPERKRRFVGGCSVLGSDYTKPFANNDWNNC